MVCHLPRPNFVPILSQSCPKILEVFSVGLPMSEIFHNFATISSKSNIMTSKRKSSTLSVLISLHVLFWLVVLERFVDTSFLRPRVAVSLEVVCIFLIIGIVYTNIFFLVPQLWDKGKKWLYALTFLLAVLCTAGVEVLMCKGDVAQKVLPYTDLHTYRMYLFDIFVSLSLRNGSFLVFSTLYVLYKLKDRAVQQGEKYISSHTENIVLLTSDECSEITLSEIVYIEVRKRVITIVTDTGNYPKNRTFSDFEKLLPPGSYMRISRQFVVMYNHIIRYTPQYVYLMNQGKEVCLTYSHSNTYNVLESLQSWDPNKYAQS